MPLDIIIIILLGLAFWRGWRSGALAMLLSIVILIVAGFIAAHFASLVGGLIRIGPMAVWPVVGFFFTFIVVLIVGSLLKKAVRPKHGIFRGLDAILGGVLGLLRGALILSLVFVIVRRVHLPPESLTARSTLYPMTLGISTALWSALRPVTNGWGPLKSPVPDEHAPTPAPARPSGKHSVKV